MSHASHYLVSSRLGLHKVSPRRLNLPLMTTSMLSPADMACGAPVSTVPTRGSESSYSAGQ